MGLSFQYIFALIMVFSSGAANAQSTVVNAKAAELAMHRIERLVTLKKIETDFQTKMQTLVVTNYTAKSAAEPSFKATLYQYPATDGTIKAVEIYQDNTGKALSFKVLPGGAAVGFPTWGGQDAISLTETALHFIEDHGDQFPAIIPYRDGLRSFSLLPAKDAKGSPVAMVGVKIDSSNKTLKILINLDATFNSFLIE